VEDNVPIFYSSPLAPQWGSGNKGIPFEEAFVRSSDGTPIHVWFLPAPPAVDGAQAATFLMCHANAGNIGHRLPLADALRTATVANLVMWDYRGYGASGGQPGEEGIKRDAEAVLAWVRRHPAIHPAKIFVMGESLGGAVAAHIAHTAAAAATGSCSSSSSSAAAAHPPLAGLLLLNTFTSISDMVDHLLPAYRAIKPFILRLRWETVRLIPSISPTPMLLISGRKDMLVPPRLMDELHRVAKDRRAAPQGSGKGSSSSSGSGSSSGGSSSSSGAGAGAGGAALEPWRTQFHEVPEGGHNDTPMVRVAGGPEGAVAMCPLFFARIRDWVLECLERQGLERGVRVSEEEERRVGAEREGTEFMRLQRREWEGRARRDAVLRGVGGGAGGGLGQARVEEGKEGGRLASEAEKDKTL
jgi:fermentation-respiration switch protein FrsA (DUF1100 family)